MSFGRCTTKLLRMSCTAGSASTLSSAGGGILRFACEQQNIVHASGDTTGQGFIAPSHKLGIQHSGTEAIGEVAGRPGQPHGRAFDRAPEPWVANISGEPQEAGAAV